ncbi:MAG: ethanolamine ammonia-lyase subunit EutC [Desulfoprunum sp.]|nr:ethanolamine ammonia-lyase subunit EutC [Desulfoprunum sp.]
MNTQTEKDIAANVIKELIALGFLDSTGKTTNVPPTLALPGSPAVDSEPVELLSAELIGVDNPHNLDALKIMRKATPARILMGRCGCRQKTASLLRFLADHAAAVDAVFKDLPETFLEQQKLFQVKTVVRDKDEYLMKPELGKRLDEASRAILLEKCKKNPQVQIIVVDGLSTTSIEANIGDVMPALVQGLMTMGVSVGTPFYVKYGRVGIMDDIAPLLGCEVIVEFIGERPGLITAESMSAYLAYKPTHATIEAERTVISNIHRGGTGPVEAGAHLATVVKQMLDHKAGGVKLAEQVK